MKKSSKYEQEINRISREEGVLLFIVMIILFFIFAVVSQEMKMQDATSLQAYQTNPAGIRFADSAGQEGEER